MLSRVERFTSIPSTNDEVRAWLADGTLEVCLAVADERANHFFLQVGFEVPDRVRRGG